MYKIIKNTLNELSQQNVDATPKNYAKEFYKQADKLHFDFDDRKKLRLILDSLCSEEKVLIEKNGINTATELLDILKNRTKNSEIINFIKHLTDFLKPSIDQNVVKKIEALVNDLQNNPTHFATKETIKKILTITELRIKQDRDALVKKSNDMKKLTLLLSKHYDKSLIQSCSTSNEIGDIKKELETLELSEHSSREVTALKTQLIDTVYKLENSLEKSKVDLLKGQDECNIFEKKIKELQIELSKVKKEKTIDYLTGVLNRRGFEVESSKIEEAFNVFNSKYAVIFYDIDDFKKINDTYGHDCGDIILSTFGSILNKLTRENDIIARFGGEEFVALINYSDEDEIQRYVKRVKEIITKNKFVYKDSVKIKLKFSAGVSFRRNCSDLKDTIKQSDLLLYNAKHSGKDKIIFDNGLVI